MIKSTAQSQNASKVSQSLVTQTNSLVSSESLLEVHISDPPQTVAVGFEVAL